jgi:quercetin dioxygenase-like cupin family protein
MSVQAVTDLAAALPMQEGGIVSKAILDLPGSTKLVLFALDAGQEITPHAAPFPAEIVGLEGRIEVSVGDEAFAILPHQAIDLPPGLPHGIVAKEPSRFLLTMRRGAKAELGQGSCGHHHAHGEGGCDHGHDHGHGDEECEHHGCSSGLAEAPQTLVNHPTLQAWMAEHDEALVRLGRMESAVASGDWGGVREGADWLYQELKLHNEAEEQHLFPLMDPFFGGGHGPTHCMREEHRQLWNLTLTILDDISAEGLARNPEDADRTATQLIGMLRAHIEKENKVLYPMAEKILSAADLAKLGAVLAKG